MKEIKDSFSNSEFLEYAIINLSEEDIQKIKDSLEILNVFIKRIRIRDEHILNQSIDVLVLSVRAHNCLLHAGCFKIRDIIKLLGGERPPLLKFKNLGRKT